MIVESGSATMGVLNFVPIRKIFQDLLGVIADGCEFDSLLFESRDSTLQLNQLPFAERSPISGAKKEQNGPVRSLQCVQRLCTTKLVARRKSGSPLTYLESDRQQLDRCHVNGGIVECPADGHTVSQVSGNELLWLKAIHDPGCIVIERKGCVLCRPNALARFSKRFISVTAAIDDRARPRSIIGRVRLPCHHGNCGTERNKTKAGTFRHGIRTGRPGQNEESPECLSPPKQITLTNITVQDDCLKIKHPRG